MLGQRLFVLIVFVTFTEYSLCKETSNSAEVLSEDTLQVGKHEISQDEISKRAIESAKTTFTRLKSTFLGVLTGSKIIKEPGPGGEVKTVSSSGSSILDMVFVMDKSGSIGQNNFNLETAFVENLIEYFPIFPTKTRVAIITYSTQVKLEFNFNKHKNKELMFTKRN